jgi:hypothetical protein
MIYIPKPIDLSDIELPDEVKGIIEILAKNTHENWAKKRIDEGWIYGNKRNDIKKHHPGLISYENLSEEEKEYDRQTAINAIKLIIKMRSSI